MGILKSRKKNVLLVKIESKTNCISINNYFTKINFLVLVIDAYD